MLETEEVKIEVKTFSGSILLLRNISLLYWDGEGMAVLWMKH